ncbi:MAG: hypothetical protein AAF458_20605 [Pseudomonadota bacterium]
MQRRQILQAAAAASLLTVLPAEAAKVKAESYSRAAFEAALKRGEPFILDFYATW